MWRRFVAPIAIAALVATAALSSASPSGATPNPPDYDSPYIAEIDAQLPTNIPWKEGTEATHRAKFARLYSVGIRWVYVWVPWTDVETSQGVYDFTKLDNYIGWARDAGILVQLQVMTGPWSAAPAWVGPKRVNPRHTGGENVPAIDLSYAVSFWVALVNRYKPGGALAIERGWQDGYGVRNWEVENEPGASVFPIYPSWGRIPKDFAAFLSMLYPAAKAAYGAATTTAYGPMMIAAPALAQTDTQAPLIVLPPLQLPLLGTLPLFGPPDTLDGIPWLEQVLSPVQSEWQSSTYDAAPTPPGGPYIDAFSFHVDNVNISDGSLPGRAQAVRNVMDAYKAPHQPPDKAVKADAQLWYTEGGALSYNAMHQKFAWAEQQVAGFLLGKQVDRLIFAFGIQFDDGDFANTPIAKAATVTTRYFPRAGNVAQVEIDPRVTAFRRTVASGQTTKWTYMLWAKNLAPGALDGAPFTVNVPFQTATGQVDFVDSNWTTQDVTITAGAVPVTLVPGDPSPVFIIAER